MTDDDSFMSYRAVAFQLTDNHRKTLQLVALGLVKLCKLSAARRDKEMKA